MKLKLAREHYITHDNGSTWTAKTPFDSEQHAKDSGFDNPNKWHIYPCSFCDKFHVATVRKGKRKDD